MFRIMKGRQNSKLVRKSFSAEWIMTGLRTSVFESKEESEDDSKPEVFHSKSS